MSYTWDGIAVSIENSCNAVEKNGALRFLSALKLASTSAERTLSGCGRTCFGRVGRRFLLSGVPMPNPEWMELLHQSLFLFSEFSNDGVLADSSCWGGNQKSRISSPALRRFESGEGAVITLPFFAMLRFSLRKLQDHFSTVSPARFIRISPLDKGTGANPPALLTYT